MKIVLKNVRCAFPNFFVAKKQDPNSASPPTFNGAFLFPPDHPQVPEIEKAIATVAASKWGKDADKVLKALKAGDKTALHNGDSKANLDGYEGNLYINASSPTRPIVLGRNKAQLTAEDGLPYSGSYVNVSIELWAQDNQYGKRVNAQLGGVQFVRDGDRFGAGSAADADDFDDLGDGADADDLGL